MHITPGHPIAWTCYPSGPTTLLSAMPVQHEPDRERPLRAKHEESLSDRQSDAISDARRKTSKFSAPEPREKLNTIMDGHSLYLRIIEQFKQRWEDVEAGSEYVERTRRAHARP